MPYQPPKKTFWEYQFKVPNIGNDGKTYYTRYEFKIDLPPLSDFEREFNKQSSWVRPMITVYIIQGLQRIKSNIGFDDFLDSPLSNLLSDESKGVMSKAHYDARIKIQSIRESLVQSYGTYYNNGTVYKESE